MASVDTLDINHSYYDPKENIPSIRLSQGNYYGHIIKVDITRSVTVRGKWCADIYNITFKVAPENKEHNYSSAEGDITGSSYIDREIRSVGIFHFLTPTNGEFEANPGGNERYMSFCSAIKVKCTETTIKLDDGEERKVYLLPDLSESDLLGKPVIASVGETKPFVNNQGEKITPMKVKVFNTWTNGKNVAVADDDLPF